MSHKTFRMELGINLKAATLSRTNPNMRLFPLQNALIDTTTRDNPRPAWYSHLEALDKLAFRLVDISDLGAPEEPRTHPLLVKFLFTDPHSGQTVNPFEERVLTWNIDKECRMRWSPVFSRRKDQRLPTWDILWQTGDGSGGEPLTLAPVRPAPYRGYEMSVALQLHRHGWFDQYVFDPEMIVSDTDN